MSLLADIWGVSELFSCEKPGDGVSPTQAHEASQYISHCFCPDSAGAKPLSMQMHVSHTQKVTLAHTTTSTYKRPASHTFANTQHEH